MATYCIGDLHGCYDEFMAMLDKIKFDDKKDTLYLTGDLIGRGPAPLKTVTTIMSMSHCVKPVLGNHDLNFLAICNGITKAKPKDNLDELLSAPNLGEILDFYYHLPFIILDNDLHLAVTHAGVYPGWELSYAKKIAKELSKVLKDDDRRDIFLRNMYKDFPVAFDERYQGLTLWRFATNVFTRMRLCSESLELDYGHSNSTTQEAATEHLYPWFNFGNPTKYKKKQYTLVFGHWAALNAQCDKANIKALDTGCVWGGALTSWCVETNKTEKVKSLGHVDPKRGPKKDLV